MGQKKTILYKKENDSLIRITPNEGNADTVGGYTAGQLIQSNPNLLTNWYFVDPVNQRGQTEYTSNNPVAMAIDGWYIGWYTVMTLEDDGIKLTATANRDYSTLRMVASIQIPTELVGKTLCASILYSTTSIVKFGLYNRENILPTSEQKTLYECEIIPTSTQIDFVAIRSEEQNANAKVYAVKLESGNHQTLAYQDSNGDWVLNDPMPNKLESALKCGPIENESQQVLYGDGKWANVPSNLNLLDNPDFKINQRGKTEYTGVGYTVDRWHSTRDTTKVEINNGVVTVTDMIAQHIDPSRNSMLVGKTLTLSCKILNGTTIKLTFTVKEDMSTWNDQPHVTDPNTNVTIFFGGSNNGTYFAGIVPTIELPQSIEYTKLELGTVATPFVPPNPAEELLKCQRYYQQLNRNMRHVGTGYVMATGTESFSFMAYCPLPTTMRVPGPTVTINGLVYVWVPGHYGTSAFTTNRLASSIALAQNMLTIPLAIDSTDESLKQSIYGLPGSIQFRDTESYIEISADL